MMVMMRRAIMMVIKFASINFRSSFFVAVSCRIGPVKQCPGRFSPSTQTPPSFKSSNDDQIQTFR